MDRDVDPQAQYASHSPTNQGALTQELCGANTAFDASRMPSTFHKLLHAIPSERVGKQVPTNHVPIAS